MFQFFYFKTYVGEAFSKQFFTNVLFGMLKPSRFTSAFVLCGTPRGVRVLNLISSCMNAFVYGISDFLEIEIVPEKPKKLYGKEKINLKNFLLKFYFN